MELLLIYRQGKYRDNLVHRLANPLCKPWKRSRLRALRRTPSLLACSFILMQLLALHCGPTADVIIPGATRLDMSEIPTRKELKAVDAAAAAILPEDPTPSLDEIAAMPDVPHLGEPQFAPQPVPEALRVVVVGSDAALSAVVTRLMRADTMWVEVAYVPTGDSQVARLWGLPDNAAQFAVEGQVRPKPLLRDDAGVAIAGIATVTAWDGGEITGEVIVDDTRLIFHEGKKKAPRYGVFGARLESGVVAPGVSARVLTTAIDTPESPSFLHKLRPTPRGQLGDRELHGRALQGGGIDFRVSIDGVSRKRPVDRVTVYRHLRDLQCVRP
ncbi:hypothetical protein FRC0050_02123 [Corynebacterium diphtheriae]|nr:hypothetical protein FRC0049_02101 [Corynebacterium diphtheriae]CAB0714650.1 hypothetical protein FRC0050_02123 [Corynebacterium diphtheriae]